MRMANSRSQLSACAVFLLLTACAPDMPSSLGLQAVPGNELDVITAEANTGAQDLKLVAELPPPKASRGGNEDVLLSGDVLQMDVFGMDKLGRTVTIDSAGRIQLPLIGSVVAAGKPLAALEREVTSRYARDYLQSPSVGLQLKESNVRRVVVDGDVQRPGAYPVSSRSTLSEALAQAGGFKDIADPKKVFVYRMLDGTKLVANYDTAAIRAGKRSDPRVYSGDVVYVFSSSARVAWQNVKDVLGVGRLFTPGSVLR